MYPHLQPRRLRSGDFTWGVFSLILAGPAPQDKSLWLPDPRRGFQKREPDNEVPRPGWLLSCDHE